jgi:hypothetical protein
MASNNIHTFATSDEQYEDFMLKALEDSLNSAKEEEFMRKAIKESLQNSEEEALIQKLDAESLHFAIQESLQLSEGRKKPSLLARREMPPLTIILKKPESSVKPLVYIIVSSPEEKDWMKTTRC